MVGAFFQLGLGLTEIGFLVFIHLFGLILAQAAAEVGEVGFDAVLLVLVQLLFAFGKSLVHLVGQHLGLIVQIQPLLAAAVLGLVGGSVCHGALDLIFRKVGAAGDGDVLLPAGAKVFGRHFEKFLSNVSHTALTSGPFLCIQKSIGNMKKIFEKIVEGILACSGFVTSLTIVLIVVFLFSEALGLFSSKVIEEGYVLALNKENRVSELTPAQIKDVFDEELTNWNEVGGEDLPIRLFRLEDITQYYTEEQLGASYENAGACITELVERTPGIIAFVPQQFVVRPDSVHLLKDNTISVKDVFAGAEWFPTATPAAQFGFLPLITGTLWVSLFAILFALPFGLSVAIYMSEVANSRVRNLLKPIIELLSGIPSVVYGFFGLIVIVPFLQQVFDLPVGESGLAGSIVLAIMALPTIITVTEDAMRNCPRAMREASLALGASQWQTIYKVVIPYSISGITSGVVLGIGRAVGETMAVLMVTGNAAVIPHTILEPLRTIPATIAAELGEAPAGGPHYEALFLLGVVLFFISLLINFTVEAVSPRRK